MDTIIAPITAYGQGAVSVLRVSGVRAVAALREMTKSSGKILSSPREQILSKIIDPETGEVLDEALVCYFPAPNSYTGEDVLEISLHGSVYITRRVLEVFQNLGVRLAEPGEFTKRAFLLGRMDLSQAEAVADVIASETALQASVAQKQLRGELSNAVSKLGEPLRNLLAEIEAYIDFPDEDIEPATKEVWLKALEAITPELVQSIASYNKGRMMREGAKVVLAGIPNAGKSSLLNWLLGTERAIVTPIPGTTRDTIEERLNIRGLLVRIIDTAGLATNDDSSRTLDAVEQIGIERSWKSIKEADLIIFIFDPQGNFASQNFLLESIKKEGGNVLVLVNKIDLIDDKKIKEVKNKITDAVFISVKEKFGKEEIDEAVFSRLINHENTFSALMITTERHLEALKGAENAIKEAINAIAGKQPPEIVSLEIRSALNHLSEIIGVTPTEDILGRIFSKFCIGK